MENSLQLRHLFRVLAAGQRPKLPDPFDKTSRQSSPFHRASLSVKCSAYLPSFFDAVNHHLLVVSLRIVHHDSLWSRPRLKENLLQFVHKERCAAALGSQLFPVQPFPQKLESFWALGCPYSLCLQKNQCCSLLRYQLQLMLVLAIQRQAYWMHH